jgi:hypothetical protein
MFEYKRSNEHLFHLYPYSGQVLRHTQRHQQDIDEERLSSFPSLGGVQQLDPETVESPVVYSGVCGVTICGESLLVAIFIALRPGLIHPPKLSSHADIRQHGAEQCWL